MGRFSLTACSITFAPTAMTGWEVFIYSLTVAAVFWMIAAAIILANRRTKIFSTVQFESTRSGNEDLSAGGSVDGL
ncbi:MAG: hypothetical protein PHD61_06345 [Bacteroidales bacterium]|nr:hypothetical protein [Lentimicrobiaceae bacterium]MDD5694908.1 hypothetical protein [Bacteroidales bacterium]